MKKLVFLSSLNNADQRGGAYLRVSSMLKVFNTWDIHTSIIYQDAIEVKGRLQKLIGSFRFGHEVRALFSKAVVEIPRCDYLVLDNFRYLHWNLIFSGPRPYLIYNAHNLEFENYYGKTPGLKRQKFSEYEAKKIANCDLILVCSQREKDILVNLNSTLEGKVFVLPNLVDAGLYKTSSEKKWITFLGSLDYFPNIEAVEFICNEFIENLDASLRDKIIIAGRNPTEEVTRLCNENGITLRENLSDAEITQLLSETKISLVPLKSGSGTRLKIIESLFSHAMVISTAMGAEGVAHDGLCISNFDNFARECSDLYQNKSFDLLCPPALFKKYLEQYDCFAWAKYHSREFEEIFTFLS